VKIDPNVPPAMAVNILELLKAQFVARQLAAVAMAQAQAQAQQIEQASAMPPAPPAHRGRRGL
jgi:hypothetical protein